MNKRQILKSIVVAVLLLSLFFLTGCAKLNQELGQKFAVKIQYSLPEELTLKNSGITDVFAYENEVDAYYLTVTNVTDNKVVISNQMIQKNQQSVLINVNKPANYKFEIVGKNSAGNVILSGSATKQIINDDSITISLVFANGNASFTITVNSDVLSKYNYQNGTVTFTKVTNTSQIVQKSLTLNQNTITHTESLQPGVWKVYIELNFTAKDNIIEPKTQKATFEETIDVNPGKTTVLQQMGVYFDSNYNIKIGVGIDLPYITPVTNLTGTYTRSSGTLQLSWEHTLQGVTYYVFKKVSVTEWGTPREKWVLVGSTNNKNYSLSMTNAEFDNSLREIAINAVLNGKESGFVSIAKSSITQR
uniref:Lipoprotein n=1 Tax=Fervidobacterium nodosum TaxID=2424 RepID=A0A7C5U4T3_9BACT